MKAKDVQRQVVRLAEATQRVTGQRVGHVVASSKASEMWVDYPDSPHGPQMARSTIAFSADELRRAIAERTEVLLTFDAERADRPIVVGILQPSPATVEHAPNSLRGAIATLDGTRVALRADDEIVLECGKSSITLRRNGRVVIQGAYVETRSQGVNRIKGGSVKVN